MGVDPFVEVQDILYELEAVKGEHEVITDSSMLSNFAHISHLELLQQVFPQS